jgi:hypothetical protein
MYLQKNSNELVNRSEILKSISFENLPNVLIQDPVHRSEYWIPASELKKYQKDTDDLHDISEGTVIFLIPDQSFIEEVPVSHKTPDKEPSILIQYPAGNTSFYLSYQELQFFKVETYSKHTAPHGIAFIIPWKMSDLDENLIEELPSLMRAGLQSNTSTRR